MLMTRLRQCVRQHWQRSQIVLSRRESGMGCKAHDDRQPLPGCCSGRDDVILVGGTEAGTRPRMLGSTTSARRRKLWPGLIAAWTANHHLRLMVNTSQLHSRNAFRISCRSFSIPHTVYISSSLVLSRVGAPWPNPTFLRMRQELGTAKAAPHAKGKNETATITQARRRE